MAEIIAFPDRKPAQHVVLVVDDEYLMRGVLMEILRDCGFQVMGAASGEEAVGYLSEPAHIDVVFSDIKMPGMDGFELARWVVENKPDVPVILASGYSGKTNMATELCSAHVLRKPFDFDQIVEKIRQVVATPRRLSS